MARRRRISPVGALALGLFAGSRAMTPLAMLALLHGDRALRGAWRDWPVFRSEAGRAALQLGAVGELVGDKLPMTPSRLERGGLVGRAATGAVAALAASTVGGRPAAAGYAVLGAVGGLAGAWLGYSIRAAAGQATRIPDPVVALAEDAVAVGG